MANLEDILLKFPENNTGAIDASDLREAFTLAYADMDALEARIVALENPAP